jgi:hypothetical protein
VELRIFTEPQMGGHVRRPARCRPAHRGDRLRRLLPVGRYAEGGAERRYLQVLDLADLDHLELIATELVPQLA